MQRRNKKKTITREGCSRINKKKKKMVKRQETLLTNKSKSSRDYDPFNNTIWL